MGHICRCGAFLSLRDAWSPAYYGSALQALNPACDSPPQPARLC